MIAIVLSNLGSISRALADYVAAEDYYQESLNRCRVIGERRWIVAGRNGLGLTHLEQEKFTEAHAQYSAALTLAQEIGSKPDLLDALSGLGEIIYRRGQLPQAAAILYFVAHHPMTQTPARQRSQQVLTHLQPQLSTAEQNAAMTLAAKHDWQEIVTLAVCVTVR